MSVGQSVRLSVTVSFFWHLQAVFTLLPGLAFSITVPAYPQATLVAVYPALFFCF